MDVEYEHGSHDPQTDVTGDDPILTGKIATRAHEKIAQLAPSAWSGWKKKPPASGLPSRREPHRVNARTTRIGMIAIALAFWLFAVAWPGMQITLLVLSGALVAFAVYGLLTEE